jgi:hypothetical protein
MCVFTLRSLSLQPNVPYARVSKLPLQSVVFILYYYYFFFFFIRLFIHIYIYIYIIKRLDHFEDSLNTEISGLFSIS